MVSSCGQQNISALKLNFDEGVIYRLPDRLVADLVHQLHVGVIVIVFIGIVRIIVAFGLLR